MNNKVKYALLIIISGFAGGLTSIGISYILDHLHSNSLLTGLSAVLSVAGTFFIQYYLLFHILFTAIPFSISILYFYNARKSIPDSDSTEDEEEELYLQQDTFCNKFMMFNSASLITNFIFLGLYSTLSPDHYISYAGVLIYFIIIAILIIAMQFYMVSMIKKNNPLKRADPFSLKFEKEWMDNCDEAELMSIYKASYKNFTLMKKVIIFSLGIVLIIGLYFEIGSLPILLIGGIWMVHTISYCYYCIKESSKKIR